MNILILTSVYPQPDDGDIKTTSTVQYFCQEWNRLGHKVIVVHNSSKFPKILYYIPSKVQDYIEDKYQIQFPNLESRSDLHRVENGIEVYRYCMLKYKPHGNFSSISISIQAKKIQNRLEEENFTPDLIIGHWANPQASLVSELKKKYYHFARTVIVFHNDCYPTDVKRYSLNKYLKDIDAIGCRNKQFSKIAIDSLKLDYEPFICYSGIPNDMVEQVEINKVIKEKEEGTILFVGRLVKYKKADAIINAIKILRKNELPKLKIVGTGSEEDTLKDMVSLYQLENNVTFIEKLSRKEVFEHMGDSECFILISENEVFGMVYFEAMLMGCITIASRGSIMDCVIEDGVNGFLCNAGDDRELSVILNRISKMSKEQKNKIMTNANATASKYSNEKVAKRYLEDIEKVWRGRELQ